MRALATGFLFFAAIASSSPLETSQSSPDGIKYCSDLTFPTNGSFQSINCTISKSNLTSFLFNLTSLDPTESLSKLNRRAALGKKPPPPPRVPENGRLLWKEVGDYDNVFKQCTNRGPAPKIADVKKLCAKVDSSYIIGRAGQGPNPGACTCKVWSQRSAIFSVCNCDRCDALVIRNGLQDKCREISQHCTTQGYSSGFMKFPNPNMLFEQRVKGKNDKVKNGVVNLLKLENFGDALSVTCKSGNPMKEGQDRTGNYIKCKRRGITKKCWRTTDPKNVWWEW